MKGIPGRSHQKERDALAIVTMMPLLCFVSSNSSHMRGLRLSWTLKIVKE